MMLVRTLLIMLVVFSPVTSVAQYDVDALQSFFTDKSQRKQLDIARSGKSADPEVRETRRVRVSGYMTRSDGKSVVWANGQNTIDDTRIDDVQIDTRGLNKSNQVTIRVDGKAARVKPGEAWVKETNQVVEDY
jgi:hypothetical protein